MKLITKISFRYSVILLFILILFSGIIYFAVLHFINKETKEQLCHTRDEVMLNIKQGNIISFPPFILVEKQDLQHTGKNNILQDTLIQKPGSREDEEYRQLTSFVNIKGQYYKIITRASLVEKDDLAETIGWISSAILIILLFSLVIITQRTTNKVLKPFYDNLKTLEQYSIKSGKVLQLRDSDIDEFKNMNISMVRLSDRAQKEYKSLKEFSENASHEIQTPLAVIKSKLDLLIQKESLDEETIQGIQILYHNVDKLSKITKSLLLMAKIENNEFMEVTDIDLRTELTRQLANLSELVLSKNIQLKTEFNDGLVLKANENLFQILISNLLSNAVKHNIVGGRINIIITDRCLTLENTGCEPSTDPGKLFKRFGKVNTNGDSNGLGLAIVKEICNLYGYKIDYSYKDNTHTIKLDFNI